MTKTIEIGKYYRHKDHPDYAYAKAIEVIPPKTGVNPHTHRIVKCEWTLSKGQDFGLIKYFRFTDLIPDKESKE